MSSSKGLVLSALFFSVAFLVPGAASAATYYVDATDGSDTADGLSTTTPWKTLSKVKATVYSAGDSILFKKGETFAGTLVVNQSGTSGSPITYGSYGEGTRPIIDATGNNHGLDIRSGKSFIAVEGLEVRNATVNEFLLFANGTSVSDITIADSVAYGGTNGGFVLQGPGTITNITITDSAASGYTGGSAAGVRMLNDAIFDTLTFDGITASSSTGQYGFTVGSGSYTNISLLNSSFSDHIASGVNFNIGTTTGIVIRNTQSTDNGLHGFHFIGEKSDIVIDQVTGSGNDGRGISFGSGGGSRIDDISIKDSTFDGNGGHGLVIYPESTTRFTENVSITSTSASGNVGAGFYIRGNVTDLTGSHLIGNDNGDNGIFFITDTGTSMASTTIMDSEFNGNVQNGVAYAGSGVGTDSTIYGTEASNNDNDGFNIHNDWTDVVFDHTTANGNGTTGAGADGDGYSYHESTTGVISNSFASNNKKSAIANVNTSSVDIYNNIFTHDTAGTFALVHIYNGSVANIYNNVFYNPSQLDIGFSGDATSTTVLANNILLGFDVGLQKVGSPSITEDYNLAYGAATANWSGFAPGAHSISVDPLFTDAEDGNFSLLPSSPAINSGTPTPYTTDYLGNARVDAPDMGIYEYQDAIEPPGDDTAPRHRSGQRRLPSPSLNSPVTELILNNRALFVWAQQQGIALPAFVLETLGLQASAIPAASLPTALFTRPLSLGSTGADVSALQRILKAKGFYAYPEITGYYGQVTLQAVADFQRSVGLDHLGYVGPATRAILNALPR